MDSQFLEFWISELVGSLEGRFDIQVYPLVYTSVPQMSFSRLLEILDNISSHVRLSTVEGGTCLEMTNLDLRVGLDVFEVTAFASKGELLELESKTYVQHLHTTFFPNVKYLKHLGSLGIHFIKPNVGMLDRPIRESKSVLVGVPLHKRADVTRVFAKYTFDYLLPMLKWKGYSLFVCFIGSQEDFESVSEFSHRAEFAFILHDNNLGDKKNTLLDLARDFEPEFFLNIDSDDLFPPSLCERLFSKACENGYWSALEPFSFYDTKRGRYLKFEGYDGPSNLHKEGMGSGRVFTKAVYALPNLKFASGNRSMDSSVKKVLSDLKIPIEDRLILNSPTEPLAIGIKTSQNIWGADNYKTSELSPYDSQIAWLPLEIKVDLERLSFEAN